MTYDDFARSGSDAPIFGTTLPPTFAPALPHSSDVSTLDIVTVETRADAFSRRHTHTHDASDDAVTRYMRAFVR